MRRGPSALHTSSLALTVGSQVIGSFTFMEVKLPGRQGAHLTHSWSAVSEPTLDSKVLFLDLRKAEGPLLLSSFPGGQPRLTARGLQRVPDQQLTAGQERGEDRDAQHVVRAQDRVAVEAGRALFIGRSRVAHRSRLSHSLERNLFLQGPFPDLGWLLFNLGRR